MKYHKNIINDIIGWDTSVWGQSLKFFDENVDFRNVKNALELGSGSYGGYSLYFASKNIDTICSNPFGDFESAKKVHSKYDFSTKIIYEKIDALDIPYENKFDCISFKSIMGILGNREERFKNINAQKKMNVWMSHSDKVDRLPNGFKVIGKTTNTKIAGMYNIKKKIFCLQFHPEVTHTDNGKKILKNFIYKICEFRLLVNSRTETQLRE